jgi:hypothetical protein
MASKTTDQYSPEVAKQRLEAALRGARIAGPKPMKAMTRKRTKRKKDKR